jgi:hypothetical protein
METPNLDNLINDLETYDRVDMLSDNGRNQLNEYRKINQALRIQEVVGQSEQLLAYTEIERRQQLIMSEPDGVVRETMIANLLVGLQ